MLDSLICEEEMQAVVKNITGYEVNNEAIRTIDKFNFKFDRLVKVVDRDEGLGLESFEIEKIAMMCSMASAFKWHPDCFKGRVTDEIFNIFRRIMDMCSPLHDLLSEIPVNVSKLSELPDDNAPGISTDSRLAPKLPCSSSIDS